MNLFSWLRQLFDDTPPAPKPRPAGWNKTLAGLQAQQRSATGDEIAWAREYEREQLRPRVRFPRDGDVYAARCEVPVDIVIYWRAPYSTSAKSVLPKGTRIRVSVIADDPEPLGVTAIPVDQAALGEQLVPQADRESANYDGYAISLTTVQLHADFELVAQPAGLA